MSEGLRFSDDFIELWQPPSAAAEVWRALERLYLELESEVQFAMTRLSSSRSFREIDEDMQCGAQPKERLFLETMVSYWRRLVLRTGLKVSDALQLFFVCCNSRNLFGAALSARAVLEHVAAFQYFVDAVPWTSNPVVPFPRMKAFFELLNRLAFGSSFRWGQLLEDRKALRKLLTDISERRPREEGLPNTDMIERLDRAMTGKEPTVESGTHVKMTPGEIRMWYMTLSDVVHPGWGGDFIYGTGMHDALQGREISDYVLKRGLTLLGLPIVEIVRYLNETTRMLRGHEPLVGAVGSPEREP